MFSLSKRCSLFIGSRSSQFTAAQLKGGALDWDPAVMGSIHNSATDLGEATSTFHICSPFLLFVCLIFLTWKFFELWTISHDVQVQHLAPCEYSVISCYCHINKGPLSKELLPCVPASFAGKGITVVARGKVNSPRSQFNVAQNRSLSRTLALSRTYQDRRATSSITQLSLHPLELTDSTPEDLSLPFPLKYLSVLTD